MTEGLHEVKKFLHHYLYGHTFTNHLMCERVVSTRLQDELFKATIFQRVMELKPCCMPYVGEQSSDSLLRELGWMSPIHLFPGQKR